MSNELIFTNVTTDLIHAGGEHSLDGSAFPMQIPAVKHQAKGEGSDYM